MAIQGPAANDTFCSHKELSLEGDLWRPPSPPNLFKQIWPRAVSNCILNVSKEGDSTTSMGSSIHTPSQ